MSKITAYLWQTGIQRLPIIGCFALVCTLVAACHQPALTDSIEEFSDEFFATGIAKNYFPGGVVVFVTRDDITFARGYGVSSVLTQDPVDAGETLFRIGSISKVFTTIQIMQMFGQGRINLDADVNLYLTSYQIPDTYDDPITIRSLLSHQAGLDDDLTGAVVHDNVAVPMAPSERAKHFRRVRPVGELQTYSDIGAALLGEIIADVSGDKYRVSLQGLLNSLDMHNTVLGVPDNWANRVAECHIFQEQRWVTCEQDLIREFGQSAGDMSSTAEDMAHFLMLLLNQGEFQGEVVLRRDLFSQMVDLDANRLGPNEKGLGLIVHEAGPIGCGAFGHGGAISGFVSNAFVSPRDGWGVFIAVDGDTGFFAPRDKLRKAADAFIESFEEQLFERYSSCSR